MSITHTNTPGGNLLTFSKSGSRKARASSLLSITEAAATSSGVDPLIAGEAVNSNEDERKPGLCCNYKFHIKTHCR